MLKSGAFQDSLTSIVAATLVSLALYSRQATLLLLKVGEVFGGVFDTSVPAFPLVGMLFVLMFIALRRREFRILLNSKERSNALAAVGIAMVALPLPGLLAPESSLSGSYVYAAIALTVSWVGALTALRPPVFKFLFPYLLIFVAAIASVSVLTTLFGDPLAVVVAATSSTITHAAGLPVQWSAVYIKFAAAGGQQVNLVITQECSGIASISIFILVVGMVHLDLKPGLKTSAIFAVGGSALFVLLNALRVVGLVLGGLLSGVDFMWSLHGWLGYALYIVGYAVILYLYAFARNRHPAVRAQPG